MELGRQPSSTHQRPRSLTMTVHPATHTPLQISIREGWRRGRVCIKCTEVCMEYQGLTQQRKPNHEGGLLQEKREDPRNQHNTHTHTADKAGRHADQEPTTDVGTVNADKVSRAGPSNFSRQECGDDHESRDWPDPFPYLASHTDAQGRAMSRTMSERPRQQP